MEVLQRSNRIASRLSAALHGPIPIDEIARALDSVGVKSGDNLLIHSSFRGFYRGGSHAVRGYISRLSPEDGEDYAKKIIEMFLNISGSNGIVMLPSDFIGDDQRGSISKQVWSLRDAMTKHRGFLPQVFRKWNGVIRSTHPIYNVTAHGKGIENELNNHWDLPYTMDIGSPWYSFMQLGGKVVFFGVDFEANSFIHLPEYVLKDNYPRPIYYNRPHIFVVENTKGLRREVMGYLHAIKWPRGTVTKFCKYLNNKYGIYNTTYVRNMPITVFSVRDQYDGLMAELEQGVSWYDAIYWD